MPQSIITDQVANLCKEEADLIGSYSAMYMNNVWGISVGYSYLPWYISSAQWEVATWQLASDCDGELCALSRGV